jgi:aldehyde dehydrogenase (NAD+)
MSEAAVFGNLTGGECVPARSGRTFTSVSPADRHEVVGVFPRSGAEDVADAVARRAAQLLRERKEDLARLMTREIGKVLLEARCDVQEAIDMADYMAGEVRWARRCRPS